MEWRPFRDFEESRVRAELADVSTDIESGRELASQYLKTLKPIVGCFAFVVATRIETEQGLASHTEQLCEAHDALKTLLAVGATSWEQLPGTHAWMNTVKVRLRYVIRTASSQIPAAVRWRMLDADARNLWVGVCEAERRVMPRSYWQDCC